MTLMRLPNDAVTDGGGRPWALWWAEWGEVIFP